MARNAEYRLSTPKLVDKILTFCEAYSGYTLYPYQVQWGKRLIRSVLENDGAEITALFSRQCIPEGEYIHTRDGEIVKIEDHPDSWVTSEADEVLEIRVKGGYVLHCTKNHPVMTNEGWVHAGKLKAGDKVEVLLKWDKFKGSYNFPIRDRLDFTYYTINQLMKEGSFTDEPIPFSSFGEDGEELGFSEVESVTKLEGTYKVYDVEYPNKGWFICGGVKVHNSGKSQAVAVISGGLLIILPQLANLPMFADDKRLEMFKRGVKTGIFAPSLRQAQITYGKIKDCIQSKTSLDILYSPEFNLDFTTNNGTTVALTNGSFVTSISASDNSNIEGESFNLIILDESQDISDYKTKKCLTGDTRLILENGEYKIISDVVKDKKDKVICFDEELKTVTSKLPYNFYDNGIQPVYELKLNNGDTIKATLNHQFLVFSKNLRHCGPIFKTVQEIIDSENTSSKYRIGVPEILPYFAEEKELDYNRGLVLGYMLGDGCMSEGSRPAFMGKYNVNERLHTLVKSLCGDTVKMLHKKNHEEIGMQEVHFSCPDTGSRKGSNLFVNYLIGEGVYGKTGEAKCLPDKLYSKKFYKGFVEGLIETDGCICICGGVKPDISFSNISYTLVRQLKDALLKFGVHSVVSLREDNGEINGYKSKPLYLLSIKSVKDIRTFSENFDLFNRLPMLEKSLKVIASKETRNESRHYPETMRFYQVTSVTYVGEEQTYCLGVDGRNFIANNMISSNSIHPMGSAYNATIVKIGTATTFTGNFYEAIERNKKEYKDAVEAGSKVVRNHFEYDYKVASKYNPMYAKSVEQEKRRLGESSDEFRMAYKLEWVLQRGMLIDIDEFESRNLSPTYDIVPFDRSSNHVAGIDVAGSSDSTVVTICEVDWNFPVIMESRIDDETGEERVYMCYNTYLKAWLEIKDVPDYEEQYPMIVDFLNRFHISRVVIDATRERALADRLNANLPYEVIPYVFTSKSKSELYKHFSKEIIGGRVIVPSGENTICTNEYQNYMMQMGKMQKSWKGTNLVVSHPQGRGERDDFPDSHALAVWGCSFEGTVNNVETRDKSALFGKNRPEQEFYKSRNKLTARRR